MSAASFAQWYRTDSAVNTEKRDILELAQAGTVYRFSSSGGRTIIDDIHDVGATLQAIIDHCKAQGASSVYSAVLVNKLHDRKVPLRADFVGVEVDDRFIFGCGMDYKGYLRNLPGIYACKE